MRIGILTFHYAYNYGAVLQAYATQKLIEKLGCEPEFINYQNDKVVGNYKRLHFRWNMNVLKNPRLSISNILRTKRQIIKERKYDDFSNKRLNIASLCYKDGDQIDASVYDIILIGSDQVWNPSLTGGMNEIYWGNVERGDNTRIIAWAPSSLDLEFSNEDFEKMKKFICNFSSISVRDESLKKIIKKITNKEISITLDPTFLLDKKDWIELCHEVPDKNYVLVYAVRHFDKTLSIAKEIAKKYHKKLVVVRSIVNPIHHSIDRDTCSPEDFLSYIYHADYVIVSSFHGTAFSIIFEKNFLNFIPSTTKDSRVFTILTSLGLEDRAINENSPVSPIAIYPNFVRAKEKLAKLQIISREFLMSSLFH